MDTSRKIEKFFDRIEPYMVVVIITAFIGILCGLIGTLFIKILDIFTDFRDIFNYIIVLMPIIGVAIVFIHKSFKCEENGEKMIHDTIVKEQDVPGYMAPILFVTTALSHLAGAAVGKLEAPIKIGGSIGNSISKMFGLKNIDRKTVIASGVAALFGSVFGAPITGTVLSYELCYTKENKKPIYLLPILVSAYFARFIGFAFGTNSFIDRLVFLSHAQFSIKDIFLIIILIAVCSVFAIIFVQTLKYTDKMFKKINNEYIRIVIGSLIMMGCVLLIGNTLFCGNDPSLVASALKDNSMWYTFILKALLTGLCLAIGFRGGAIGPAVISGATLGILLASLLGINLFMGAAIGAVCLFGGITGCYVSAIALGVEVFGLKALVFYVLIALIIRVLIKYEYIDKKF